MKEKKTILFIEDEKEMAEVIVEGFKRSSIYDFKIEIAMNLKECVKKRLDKREFDISLIDLRLTEESRLFGLDLISICSFNYPGSLIIVYSAYPQIPNIVRSIRLGATAFISKAECAPHELIGKIEKLLDEKKHNIERKERFAKLIENNYKEWLEDYAGQVIVVVGDEVVASGKSRLEAMVRYDELFKNHSDWPVEPDVIEIEKTKGNK
jgi:DNA-binding NtrC family response regulator